MASEDLKPCPDCGVEVDKPHEGDCDVARCLWAGGQRLQCDGVGPVLELLAAIDRQGAGVQLARVADKVREWLGPDAHDCGEDVWTGEWPGVEDAIRLGFWCTDPARPPMRSCPPDYPGASPDLNRLLIEAEWDREQKQWVKR